MKENKMRKIGLAPWPECKDYQEYINLENEHGAAGGDVPMELYLLPIKWERSSTQAGQASLKW